MKTKFMKNDVLEIYIPDPEKWSEKLKTLEVVKETALFGSGIHAVVWKAGEAIPVIKKEFEKEKEKSYQINKIPPSLEDVFVALIEDYDREHPGDKR